MLICPFPYGLTTTSSRYVILNRPIGNVNELHKRSFWNLIKIVKIVSQVVRNITSDDYARETFLKINDFSTENNPEYYGAGICTLK